jgi:hypothetical protein
VKNWTGFKPLLFHFKCVNLCRYAAVQTNALHVWKYVAFRGDSFAVAGSEALVGLTLFITLLCSQHTVQLMTASMAHVTNII